MVQSNLPVLHNHFCFLLNITLNGASEFSPLCVSCKQYSTLAYKSHDLPYFYLRRKTQGLWATFFISSFFSLCCPKSKLVPGAIQRCLGIGKQTFNTSILRCCSTSLLIFGSISLCLTLVKIIIHISFISHMGQANKVQGRQSIVVVESRFYRSLAYLQAKPTHSGY